MKWSTGILVLVLSILVVPAHTSAEEAVRIAALYNLTGGMASIDGPGLNGVQLQVNRVNQSGGVLNGKRVELIVVDTRTDEKRAAEDAERIVKNDVVAGVGYGDTSWVMAVGPAFQKAGIAFVTSGATHPLLPGWFGNYVVMAAFGDDDQAFAVADFARKRLQVKRLAVWTDQSMDFTKTLSRYFIQRTIQQGGEIAWEDRFMAGDTEFSSQIEQLKRLNPPADAIFVSAVPSEAGLAVRDIRQAGIDIPILSGDGFDTGLVVSVPGEKLSTRIYFATHSYREERRPEVVDFIRRYEAAYGHPPENAFAALGYDAAGMILTAVETAGATDPDTIRSRLWAIRDYPGVTGNISYHRFSGVPAKPVSILSVDQGRYRVEETWMPEK